jgi:hypothetical protein
MTTLRDILATADPDSLWRDDTGQIWDLYDLRDHWQGELDAEWRDVAGYHDAVMPARPNERLHTTLLGIPGSCDDPHHHPYGCECEAF